MGTSDRTQYRVPGNYEPVIGLEVHLQLNTQSKLFCGCATTFGAPPNSQTCPVCLGLPGVLPVLNQQALEWGIKAALAFDCRLAPVMKFDRKQYFYPDLPKGYQISQFDQPLAQEGHLDIPGGEATTRVRIRRIHLEEDAGKLLHDPQSPASYVDFNRAGVALLEIVTEPDLRAPEDAQQYLLELKAVLEYLDISTCDMEKGSLRCDTNISLRKSGATELGSKVEVKNLNSFKAVKAALHYEIARQTKLLDAGQRIPQETRLWDAKAEVTESMRSKEEASDYRYFPEPDLVPFTIKPAVREAVAKQLPVLPAQRRAKLIKAYGISAYDANVLTQHRSLAELFEGAIANGAPPKPVANWIMGDLLAYVNAQGKQPEDVRIQPVWLVHLIEAIESGTISGKMAKELFLESIEQQTDPADIIKDKGLRQIVDEGQLERLADEVLAGHQKSVDDYRNGKANVLMFLVGQCMQRSKGKANPTHMTEILKRKLDQAKKVRL